MTLFLPLSTATGFDSMATTQR